jgi:hypothetical protein
MTKETENNGELKDEAISYDFADFEKRLQESRQEFNDKVSQSVFYKEPQHDLPMEKVVIPDARVVAEKIASSQTTLQSSLLDSLALEAKNSQQVKQTLDQKKQAGDQQLHEALQKILAFIRPFSQHVNQMEPSIGRMYRLDARTVYDKLKWQGAIVDSRKQSLSDSAYLTYVALSVSLVSPEPLMIIRPWNQFDALKKELHHLRLRTLDDLDAIHKSQKQEWLQARLDPALPQQLVFKGNYDTGKIEGLAINLQYFGRHAFILDPTEISTELLDGLGLYLIGRSETPPALMCAVER